MESLRLHLFNFSPSPSTSGLIKLRDHLYHLNLKRKNRATPHSPLPLQAPPSPVQGSRSCSPPQDPQAGNLWVILGEQGHSHRITKKRKLMAENDGLNDI